MKQTKQATGSATRWGPLFGERARDWADTWEGPSGWGTRAYEHVLARARIGTGTRVLDCGCGAGRFARLAADRGAQVAGIDAASQLVEIAAKRTPEGNFRVGDLEALPWPDGSFDVATGFSAFQFADDKVRALTEAHRVSRGPVVVVAPSRPAESGIAAVFKPVFPLFAPKALADLKQSGIFALSEPGKLDEVLAAASLTPDDDIEIDCPTHFPDLDTAVRAFLGAGPMRLAIQQSGKQAVGEIVRDALFAFRRADGDVLLPAVFRICHCVGAGGSVVAS